LLRKSLSSSMLFFIFPLNSISPFSESTEYTISFVCRSDPTYLILSPPV
jgi:hypothetical protein